jgi:stage III sporulation protein AB
MKFVLKFVLLIVVFLISAGVGAVYALELLSKRRQIDGFLLLIRYLRREIRCSASPLHRIFSGVDCPVGFPLIREMNFSEPFDLCESYRRAKAKSKGEIFFSEQDWKNCDELFESLGRGDLQEQEQRLVTAEEYFNEARKSADDAVGKKGKSALVLGCSVGVVLVMMLW